MEEELKELSNTFNEVIKRQKKKLPVDDLVEKLDKKFGFTRIRQTDKFYKK